MAPRGFTGEDELRGKSAAGGREREGRGGRGGHQGAGSTGSVEKKRGVDGAGEREGEEGASLPQRLQSINQKARPAMPMAKQIQAIRKQKAPDH